LIAPPLMVLTNVSWSGRPTDNAFAEAFNGRFHSDCRNTHQFLAHADAAEKVEAWLRYHNEDPPHGASGQKPPISLLNHDGAASPPS
jgi:putative transposase